ncbi:MAG TPA: hypothetical protein VGM90_17715 [Kofleriaceae bacterium]
MPKQLDRVLILGGLLVWVVASILVVVSGQALAHDEAAFAIGAKRILAGAPAVMLQRSVGTELLAVPGTLLGGSEIALRSLFAVVSVSVPLGACALARAAFPSRNAGGLAVAILACSHPMLLQAGQVMSDLPATGALLFALAILSRELSREDGPRWTIVGAAPLLVAAFYLRYGSAPAIASVVVAVLVCYARQLVRSSVRALVLGGVGLALIAPHLIYALHATGSPLGVVRASAESTLYLGPGRGLLTYISTNPFLYYGSLVVPVMLVGLVSAWRSREGRCIAIAALGTLIVLGIRSHAQPRYAFPWVAMLVVLGAGWLASAAKDRAKVVTVVAIAAWFGTLIYVGFVVRHQRSTREPLVQLARDIAQDAAGRPCTLTAARIPVLAFYSGCLAVDWPEADQTARDYLVAPTPENASLAPPDVPDRHVTRMATHPGVFIID